MEKIVVTKHPNPDPDYLSDLFDVLIGNNTRIFVDSTSADFIISNWIQEVQKTHHKMNKNRPLIIGFTADGEVKPKKRRSFHYKNDPYEILTLCAGSNCLIVHVWDLIDMYGYKDVLKSSREFPNSLKNLLTDPNTVLVGSGIGNIAKKLEKDFQLSLGKTVDLKSLVMKGLASKGEEELERKLRGCKFDDVLSGLMEPEIKMNIQRPTDQNIDIWSDEWMRYTINMEKVKYTTFDCFVAWKIGTKYVDLLKNNA